MSARILPFDVRRVAAFFFSDIEGSTARLQQLGHDAYAELLAAHHSIVGDAVGAYGGVIEALEGDGVFAVFESPSSAIAAALSAQRGFAAVEWVGGPLRVRMGVHTGEGAREPSGWVGLAVHLAARIASAANGGQVLLSNETVRLIGGELPAGAHVRALGRFRLKDFADPVGLSQLVHPDLDVDLRAPRASEAVATNLPAEIASFVGRDRERAEVATLIGEHRLVTIVGPGGAGKTSLSLAVARELVGTGIDAVYLCELADVERDGDVATTVATRLGVADPGDDATTAVTARIGAARIVLLVDNCEHLLDGTARLVDAVLRRCAQARVLLTSREPLRVHGEMVWRIPPLEVADERATVDELRVSDGVRVFLDRAGAVADGEALGDVATIASICRRLDGMPLSIELAAARTRIMSPTDILRRLDDAFRVLVGGNRTALPRQQTMRATIEWSHALLSETEGAVFRRLAVFAGGFSLTAAGCVAADEQLEQFDAMDAVGALVDKSMVVVDTSSGETRCRLLETMRQFATEQLAIAQEGDEISRRHFEYYRALVSELAAGLYVGTEDSLDALRVDIANIEAALAWGFEHDATQAAAFVGDVWSYWYVVGPLGSGPSWTARAIDAVDDDRSELRAVLLDAAGVLALYANRPTHAIQQFEEAATLAKSLRSTRMTAKVLVDLSWARLLRRDGNPVTPAAQALPLAQALDDRVLQAEACVMLARSALAGFDGDAGTYAARAVALTTDLGGMTRSAALQTAADVAFMAGRIDEAEVWHRQLIDIGTPLDNPVILSIAHFAVGQCRLAAGDREQARAEFASAFALARRGGDTSYLGISLGGFAVLALQDGDAELAARLIGASETEGGPPLGRPVAQQPWIDARDGARRQLTEALFNAALAEGRQLGIEGAAKVVGLFR
jgi:predicted ATPase/class 3 adenylate cyclase